MELFETIGLVPVGRGDPAPGMEARSTPGDGWTIARRVTHTCVEPRVALVKRRTVLRSAGVAAMAGLAGCVEGIQSHFQGSFQGVVPIEITNEGTEPQNIQLEAYETESDRQTYDQGYSVNIDERVGAPNLEATEQRFRATRIEDDEQGSVDTAVIMPDTQLVLIRLYDDDVEIELITSEEEAENETAQDGTGGAEPRADGDETEAGT